MKPREIMQAYKEGAEIEYFSEPLNQWLPAKSPTWNWETRDYRVKPLSKEVS